MVTLHLKKSYDLICQQFCFTNYFNNVCLMGNLTYILKGYILYIFIYRTYQRSNAFLIYSLKTNGPCCADYYRDVKTSLCKRKNGDVFIVLLTEISSKYEPHYIVYL